MSSIYSLSARKNDGTILSMETLRGKIIYATNVASMWGETDPGYNEFYSLSKRYGPENLVILAFPSREYAFEEFETDAKIRDFAQSRGFPTDGVGVLMALGSVKGGGAPEVWKFMRDWTGMGDPRWNFSCKFLVNREGRVSVPQGNMIHEIAWLL